MPPLATGKPPRTLLEFLIPTLPEALLAADLASEFQLAVANLPAAPAGWFECHLGAEGALPDCGLMMEPSLLATPAPVEGPPAVRRLLLRLGETWLDGLNNQASDLSMLLLEFDQPLLRKSALVPLPFFSLSPAAALDRNRHLPLVEIVLKWLGQTSFIPEVQRVLARLPAGTSLDQFGVISAREEPIVRLNLGGLEPRAMADILGSCGWPGDISSLASDLQVLVHHCQALEACLDVHPHGVGPRLGLECFGGHLAGTDIGMDLPSYLVQIGLCTPAKAQALHAWSAVLQPKGHAGSWPQDHRWSERLLAGSAVRIIRRWLNHIKLIHQDGRWCEAKAYLFFGQEWWRQRGDQGELQGGLIAPDQPGWEAAAPVR
jgi:hypothetical protein